MKKKDRVNINERITNIASRVSIENDCVFANIRFRNLNYGKIIAIKFICKGYNSLDELVKVDGEETFTLVCQDLEVDLKELAEVKVLLPNSSIRRIEVKEDKIGYDDGRVINIGLPQVVEYEYDVPTQFENQEEFRLVSLIKEDISEAVCLPQEVAGGYVCVCGRLNDSMTTECCFCGQERKNTLERYSGKRLRGVLKERVRREEQERLKKQREYEQKRILEEAKEKARVKRRKVLTIASAIGAAILAIALLLNEIHIRKL